MIKLLILLFLLIGTILLYNNYVLKYITKKENVLREGISSKCKLSEIQEMSGLVYQLNSRVKNLETEINKVKLNSSKALDLAKENKETIDESSESIQEDQGEMKVAEKELDEISSGL
jgi:methyl-accepting chemotaxis protein